MYVLETGEKYANYKSHKITGLTINPYSELSSEAKEGMCDKYLTLLLEENTQIFGGNDQMRVSLYEASWSWMAGISQTVSD